MDELLVQNHILTPPVLPGVDVDERAARETLRTQIARLERELADAVAESRPGEYDVVSTRRRGPRLLSLGELEQVRDDLAERLHGLRSEHAARAEREAAKRELVERMLLDPGHYRWVRVTGPEVGEHICKSWHVRPRLGIIGALAGWWHVKISSGCPLATAAALRRGCCTGGRTRSSSPSSWSSGSASGPASRSAGCGSAPRSRVRRSRSAPPWAPCCSAR